MMRPQELQRLLKSQSEVLSRLYADYNDLRDDRKACYASVDAFANYGNKEYAEIYRSMGESATRQINKLKKRIAGLEECQKELKSLLRHAQVVALLDAEDDAFWLAQGGTTQEVGDAEPKGAVNIWFDECSGTWQV